MTACTNGSSCPTGSFSHLKDQCMQARYTVDGPTPSVYYGGAQYSNSSALLYEALKFSTLRVKSMHNLAQRTLQAYISPTSSHARSLMHSTTVPCVKSYRCRLV